METKRLIVSTNYINLHARERERGRKKEFKGKERFMEKTKKEEGNRFRVLQQQLKSPAHCV